MARTHRNENVVGNEKSNKSFKKSAHKKFRKQTKNLIKAGKFDALNESLTAVSEFWTSNKEYRKFNA
jgi:hypothetical protein